MSVNRSETVKPRGPGRKWQPGQSGNPNGRPKIVGDIRDMARKHTADAMQALIDVATDKEAPQSARVAAATALLDRGYGKPTQHIEANVNILDKLSDVEQRSLAAALADLTGEPGASIGGTSETHH